MAMVVALLTWASADALRPSSSSGGRTPPEAGTKHEQQLLCDYLHRNRLFLQALYPKTNPIWNLRFSTPPESNASQVFDKYMGGERLFSRFVRVPFIGVGEKTTMPKASFLLLIWFISCSDVTP